MADLQEHEAIVPRYAPKLNLEALDGFEKTML